MATQSVDELDCDYLTVALAGAAVEVAAPSDAVATSRGHISLSPLPLTFRSIRSVVAAVVAVRLTMPFTVHVYL